MLIERHDFDTAVARHHRELHVHCYRMLGSFDEAEDLVQDTFMRAWAKRASFGGEQNIRAWLYRIATNACLDVLRARGRKPATASYEDMPWITGYPDNLLDELAPPADEPEAATVARETIELAYIAIMQLLPPRQRAVVILRDVLDFSAAEAAEAMDLSVAAANSALQRARATLAEKAPGRRLSTSTTGLSDQERRLLDQFIASHERMDAQLAIELAHSDIVITMPPHPQRFDGVAAMQPLLERAFGPDEHGEWRLVATRVNRMPAAASYYRAEGETTFRPFKLDVLHVEGESVREITTFGPSLFVALGLSATLPV